MEHVRSFQCERCGLRTARNFNVGRHDKENCTPDPSKLITEGERARFQAILSAGSLEALREAVNNPTEYFDRDYTMQPPRRRGPPMRGGTLASRASSSRSSDTLAQPGSSQTASHLGRSISQRLSQTEESVDSSDIASQMEMLKGQVDTHEATMTKRTTTDEDKELIAALKELVSTQRTLISSLTFERDGEREIPSE